MHSETHKLWYEKCQNNYVGDFSGIQISARVKTEGFLRIFH